MSEFFLGVLHLKTEFMKSSLLLPQILLQECHSLANVLKLPYLSFSNALNNSKAVNKTVCSLRP